MATDMQKLIAILVVAYLIFGQPRAAPAAVPATPTIPPGKECNYAPKVQLYEIDKWDADKPDPNKFQYILNDGASTTDTDGNFEVQLGDTLKVLWGAQNTSLYYKDIGAYTITECGLRTIKSTTGLKSGQTGLIQNKTITIQCFNEEGNVIDDTSENETLGVGDSVSLRCELRGTAEKGMPHGGTIVAEFNESLYQKDKFSLTGDVIGDKATIPGAYSNRNTADTQKAYVINPIIDAGVWTFYTNIQVDTDTGDNPNGETSTNDITLKLYGIDAFFNSETGDFEIAVEDQDDVFTKNLVGSETIHTD